MSDLSVFEMQIPQKTHNALSLYESFPHLRAQGGQNLPSEKILPWIGKEKTQVTWGRDVETPMVRPSWEALAEGRFPGASGVSLDYFLVVSRVYLVLPLSSVPAFLGKSQCNICTCLL